MITEKTRTLELNQTSLQDFIDCPRRFELNYLTEANWPAAHSSPLTKYENLAEIGSTFHHLCQQYFAGIDSDLISATIRSQDILILWQSFLPYASSLKSLPLFYEQILRVSFEDYFLVAKFDLVVQKTPDTYLIIDWKTATKKPSRMVLANRIQTILYPFIFKQAGDELFEVDSISPEQITMQYWYPLASDPEEVFPYSESKHQDVYRELSQLLSDIKNMASLNENFPLTDEIDRCAYCRFRSFCERSFHTNPLPAGAEIESEDLSNSFFDWELIKEIEY
jgi:hypothetical protein